MHRRLTGFIASLLLPLYLLSQQEGNYNIQQFNTENGLPSNGIKGLQWDDSTGFLWIATEAGIVRYNGQFFKTFTADDNLRNGNERMLFLARNKSSKLVTVDNAGNIYEIKKNRLEFVVRDHFNGSSGQLLPLLAVSDKMFAGRRNFSYGNTRPQFARLIPVSDTAVFFTLRKKLFYHSISKRFPEEQENQPQQWAGGFTIGSNIFFVNDQATIYRYAQNKNEFTSTVITDKATGIVIHTTNALFVWENGMPEPLLFKDNKVWQLAYADGKLTAALICDEVPKDMLIRYAWYAEKYRMLVIGTDSKGIYLIRKNAVATMQQTGNVTNTQSSYYAQVSLPGNAVLTSTGQVIGENPSNVIQPPIHGKFSLSVFKDGDSVLYYSQRNIKLNYTCLNSYNYRSQRTTIYPKIHSGDQLIMERSGKYVYSLSATGIARLQQDSLFYLYRFDAAKTGGNYFDIKEMAPGVLMIAGCSALLRYTIASNSLDTVYKTNGYCIRTLWKYNDYLFFGTYGNGLYAYKNGNVIPLPLDKNRYLLYTHCFIKDAENNCWISTNKGLFKVPLANLTEAVDKQATQLFYYYFGRQDGMETTELNGGCRPCAIALQNAVLSFPSMDGLMWVHPETAGITMPDGKIYIDNISADSTLINPDSIAIKQIPFGTSELLFRFAFPAWCNRENIFLEYQLNGDNNWKPIRLENPTELRFGNLPNGKYELLIRMPAGFGLNNFTYKKIEFTVQTPWFKKPFFFIIASILMLACIYYIFRLRTRHLLQKQTRLQLLVDEKTVELKKKNDVLERADTVKTRLISIISHDIVTPLKFLTTTSRNLAEKRDLMSDDLQQETLDEIMHTSHQLQQLSTNILNWIKYQNENRRLAKETFSVYYLTSEVLRIFVPIAREKEIRLNNVTDQHLFIHQYYEPLTIILYNLISNAINFSTNGTINLRDEPDGKLVKLIVEDEGVGITPEQIKNIMASEYIVSSANADKVKGNGLGYLIIKDLLKIMNGTLTIESKKGVGTKVIISVGSSVNLVD